MTVSWTLILETQYFPITKKKREEKNLKPEEIVIVSKQCSKPLQRISLRIPGQERDASVDQSLHSVRSKSAKIPSNHAPPSHGPPKKPYQSPASQEVQSSRPRRVTRCSHSLIWERRYLRSHEDLELCNGNRRRKERGVGAATNTIVQGNRAGTRLQDLFPLMRCAYLCHSWPPFCAQSCPFVRWFYKSTEGKRYITFRFL